MDAPGSLTAGPGVFFQSRWGAVARRAYPVPAHSMDAGNSRKRQVFTGWPA